MGTPPRQCYAGRRGRATRQCPPVSVSAPAFQHSQRGPHLSGRGGLPTDEGLHPLTRGLRLAEESRPALTPQPGLGNGLVTPAKTARPGSPDESCSVPRGTASGRAGVSPPRRHPQSSHPARNKNSLGQVARPLSLCCPHLQRRDASEMWELNEIFGEGTWKDRVSAHKPWSQTELALHPTAALSRWP